MEAGSGTSNGESHTYEAKDRGAITAALSRDLRGQPSQTTEREHVPIHNPKKKEFSAWILYHENSSEDRRFFLRLILSTVVEQFIENLTHLWGNCKCRRSIGRNIVSPRHEAFPGTSVIGPHRLISTYANRKDWVKGSEDQSSMRSKMTKSNDGLLSKLLQCFFARS